MNIYLCDDNPVDLIKYSNKIAELAAIHKIEVGLFTYKNGYELLFDFEDRKTHIDVIYLEVNMPGINGIEIAEQLRAQDYMGEIIFLTESERHFLKAFDVGAFNYMIKRQTPEKRFEQIFLKACKSAEKKNSEIILLSGGGEFRNIEIKEIIYFSVDKRIVTVYYGKNETFEFFSSIEKLENQLFNKGFVRSHRAYLVSLSHIKSMTHNDLFLSNGAMLPLGRTRYKQIKETLKSWGYHIN